MPKVHKDLFPYQRQGVAFLYKNPKAILADSMGIGKSAQSIGACDALDLRNILVICPGIARWNWANELNTWSVYKRQIQVVESSKDHIYADVVITSYSLISSIPVLSKLLQRQWDVIIADECVAVKSAGDTRRSRAMYGQNFDGKTGLVSKSKRVWLLSGTIMPNHPGELWTHCNALFPGVSNGMGLSRWEEEYCVKASGTERVVGAKNQAQLAGLLKPHVLRRVAEDVLPQLPPLRFSHVPVSPASLPPMSSDLKETAAVVQAAIKTLEAGNSDQGRRMLADIEKGQMASLRKWTGLAKAPAVVEYIKADFDAGMDRIVVFAWHRDVMTYLGEHLPNSAIINGSVSPKNKEAILQEFKKSDTIRSLILQMTVASTAINLVNACNAAVAEPPWVPSDLSQALARLHRQGQIRPVTAKLFSLQGSFDETVVNVLARKLRITGKFHTDISTKPA